jgi:hypothetical protein
VSRKIVVEEFCTDSDCPREETHWHALTIQSLAAEKPGEYTITVRVREIKTKRARRAKRAKLSTRRAMSKKDR